MYDYDYTEAEYLADGFESDFEAEDTYDDWYYSHHRHKRIVPKLTNLMLETYAANKKAVVGADCLCPICGKHFTKKQYSQAFDKIICKDKYHNRRRANI